MLVSSVRHLPTYVKARPAPDALSPGRARFPTGIARSSWATDSPGSLSTADKGHNERDSEKRRCQADKVFH